MAKNILLFLTLLLVMVQGYSQTDKAYIVYETDSKIIYDVCFTAAGGALLIADHTAIKAYATGSKELLYEFKNGHTAQIQAIAIARDSSLLVSGGKDSTIVIWDVAGRRKLQTLTFHQGIVTSLDLSPDGRYLVSGATDNKVCLYDLKKNEKVQVFTGHQDDVTVVKFSPDGKLIATAGGDKLLHLYAVEDRRLVATLRGHKDWIRDVSFSSDSKRLISCGDDSRVISWNIADPANPIVQFDSRNSFSWLLSTDFHADNKVYAYGGLNGKGKVVTPFGGYTFKVGRPIHKILFKPGNDMYMKTAVATGGNGVMLIDVQHLKSEKR